MFIISDKELIFLSSKSPTREIKRNVMVDRSKISLMIPYTNWFELKTNNLKTSSTPAEIKNNLN